MPHPIGPDLIGIQVKDLDAARSFYTDVVGLTVSPFGPPGAVVFDTKPIPFAVRTPVFDLDAVETLGQGGALWFGCDDADALHVHLIEQDVAIDFAPTDGAFGGYFAFRDPFGDTITAHTVQAG
ncbi:VOC family protein [Pseudooceanicola spongiae]|jgi:catechol 2,3-dioxygenase-like lactoylglutathione lyase family enzyme|uniref:VOC family protein n=1 Tax=Pseudooceanicola spongiae TaxID=2613965 RepID=A0A7M3V2R1_9RHOB|nr:VOC family protein [Pseudooceanicola spongiae]QOL79374.1 VOC family protein [Pseudooceanicola spongiae]